MKVAMVSPWMRKCGIYTYTDYLSKALADNDVDVYITRLPRFGQKYDLTMDYVARRVPKDIDLIHVQHEYGLYQNLEPTFYMTLLTHRKPIVTTMHAVGMTALDNIIAENSDKLIVHNKFCKDHITHDSVIIPHGCHPEKSIPVDEAKKLMGIPNQAKIVGYIGFISEQKGLEDLIESVSQLDYAGVLIGGGWHAGPGTDYMNRLRMMANEKMPGRCQWTGYVDAKDLAKVYGCMDLVVVCSRYATESGALLNAMSYGKPVIARDIGPFREKAEEKALVTYESIENLKELVDYFLRDDSARETLRKGAINYTANHRWNPEIANKHIKLYEELLQ